MKQPREILIDWLRDAHAMETNLIQMLGQQADHLDDHPELQARTAAHKEESRRHAERIEECLAELGTDPSAVKEGFAKLSGMFSPLPAAMSSDTAVKIVLANYSAEHFEIACYQSLEAAARHCGEERIAQAAAEILRDEEEMAEFLQDAIEEVTHILKSEDAGVAAH
jgi:ferritin-like metal-binding protein YciE